MAGPMVPVSLEDVARLVREVYLTAVRDAQAHGDVDADGEPNWRRHMAVDLQERWDMVLVELDRLRRAGPPAREGVAGE